MNLELKVIPPVQAVISATCMYGLAYLLPNFIFQWSMSWLLITLLLLVATTVGILALHDFRKHKTTFHPHTPEKTSTVVNTGVYAYSRNPMYIAILLLLTAFAIYLQNYSCFAIIPLFIGYITRFQIIPEERILNRLFPDDFKSYCQKVRRWI